MWNRAARINAFMRRFLEVIDDLDFEISSPYSRGSFHVEWGLNGSHKSRLGCFSVSEDRELTLAGLQSILP